MGHRPALHSKNNFVTGLVSQQQYEFAVKDSSIQALAVSIADAKFKSVSTGSKIEQVHYVEATIAALERRITALNSSTGFSCAAPSIAAPFRYLQQKWISILH